MSFDPNSTDSMFSTIIARLGTQDRLLAEIRDGVQKTNGRVSGLERWRDIVTAKGAGIALAVSMIVSAAAYFFTK